jgi:hypothetical protein
VVPCAPLCARQSKAQKTQREQELRLAKWRYLLRHRLFRDDIKMFRCTGYAQSLSPEQLFAKCRFPTEILDPALQHPNEWNIDIYEKLYTPKENYADPEVFWQHIECGDVKPLPKLILGRVYAWTRLTFIARCSVALNKGRKSRKSPEG